MRSFDDNWLTLREPFDHACRNQEVLRALAGWAAGRSELRVLDLGGGTGSNLRFLAPRLGMARQEWTIVDHDPCLLASVARHVTRWAEAAEMSVVATGSGLIVEDDNRRWSIELLYVDLARADSLPVVDGIDLVTASALLDLVSAAWVERISAQIDAMGAGQYWALTYDGRITWSPVDPKDDPMRELFNRHQRTDKGFGPALGPSATDQLSERLEALGRTIVRGRSDWSIGPSDCGMQRTLLDGFVAAALEISPCAAGSVGRWLADRAAVMDEKRSYLVVGHEDLFAH